MPVCSKCGTEKHYVKNPARSLYICPNCNPEFFEKEPRHA